MRASDDGTASDRPHHRLAALRPFVMGGGQVRIGAFAYIVVACCVMACGGAAAPTPTPNTPDAGECVDLTGPQDDITMTVVECATGHFEVLQVIPAQLNETTCPTGTTDEIESRFQAQRPGQTDGGFLVRRYCLREWGAPTPPPTAAPTPTDIAIVEADDVKYTSQTGLGDSMTITLTLTNSGTASSAPITFEIGGMAEVADVVGCTPECAVDTMSGDHVLSFVDGVDAGASADYEVELVTTAAGSVEWTLSIVEGATNEIFRGSATTEIE